MQRALSIVDAFADRPFGGNPAAVLLLAHDDPLAADDAHADATRLHIAGEMNLSETAFVTLPPEGSPEPFALRWYTPAREVDLCGHATLAAAHALYDAGRVSLHQPLSFMTRSGVLRASPDADWRGFWLDFPATPPAAAEPADGVLSALGIEADAPLFTGRSRPPDGDADGSDNDYFDWFIELPAADAIARLDPDVCRLAELTGGDGNRGIVVSARGTGEFDVVSRCFYPAYGIDEDPVTGSAHCTIGPYFARELGRSDGDVIRCHQASRRGGELRVVMRGDRVHIGGRAVTVVRGNLVA